MLPSELAAHPEKYNGRHVIVRGFVVLGPESRNIFNSKQGSRDAHGVCLGLDGPEAMFTGFHSRYVTRLSGTFWNTLCGPHDVCLFWCGKSGIRLDAGSRP